MRHFNQSRVSDTEIVEWKCQGEKLYSLSFKENSYSSVAHGANDNKHFIVLTQRHNKLSN